MKVIHDKAAEPKRFPLGSLLARIAEVFDLGNDEVVQITRIGGAGSVVRRYEMDLDEGRRLSIAMSALRACAEAEGQVIDLLYCIHHKACFGIIDSHCMFVQAADKALEDSVTHSFVQVEEIPDHRFGGESEKE